MKNVASKGFDTLWLPHFVLPFNLTKI